MPHDHRKQLIFPAMAWIAVSLTAWVFYWSTESRFALLLAIGFSAHISLDIAGRVLGGIRDKMVNQIKPPLDDPITPRTHVPTESPGPWFHFDFSPDIAETIEEAKSRNGDNVAEAFRKALALYVVAADAKADGKKLAVVESEMSVGQEITGF